MCGRGALPTMLRVKHLLASLFVLSSAAGPAPAQQATVSGPLRIQIDMPLAGTTVTSPFGVGGWALDQLAPSGTGIDEVDVWAIPPSGPLIFLGTAALGVTRPDVAASFGARFATAGFNLTVTAPLAPGAYTLAVFGRRASTGTFDIVDQVPIAIRGVTLTDLFPCTAGQVP